MLKNILLIFTFVIAKFTLLGQTCTHSNLSKAITFETKNERIKRINNDDSCIIIIIIRKKSTNNIIQTIKYNSVLLYGELFEQCNFVRSYSTNINTRVKVQDYDFGDLIIADLNFDGRDDFAVKNDTGGNGGPFYNFYIQNSDGHFSIDNFLTDSVGSFPKYINKAKKTITTQIHANAYEECKNIYQLNLTNSSWKRIKQTFVKY